MKKSLLILTLLTIMSLACSLSGIVPSDGETVSNPAAEPAQLAPAAPIDPRLLDTANLEECSIISDAELSVVLNETPNDRLPAVSSGETGCDYSFASGKTFSLAVTVDTPGRQVYDDLTQYIDVMEGTEQVALGEVAIIKETDGMVYFDAVFNGWYVSLKGYGFPREVYLTLAQWLSTRFIPFVPVTGAEQPAAAVTSQVSGTLIDMQVTIESPAEMAGTTTLAALNAIGFMGFSLCSTPIATPFLVMFNTPPAVDPPALVGVFSVTAENGVIAGQPTPALISIGLGRSDVAQVNSWQGMITVAPDGTSGTFEATGQVKGSWTCTFAP